MIHEINKILIYIYVYMHGVVLLLLFYFPSRLILSFPLLHAVWTSYSWRLMQTGSWVTLCLSVLWLISGVLLRAARSVEFSVISSARSHRLALFPLAPSLSAGFGCLCLLSMIHDSVCHKHAVSLALASGQHTAVYRCDSNAHVISISKSRHIHETNPLHYEY